MVDLSNRPLLDTRRDAALFIDRERELQMLRDSVKRRFNTLVLGAPGSGKTSLLMRLAFELRQEEHATAFVVIDGAAATSATEFLALLATRLDQEYGSRQIDGLATELGVAEGHTEPIAERLGELSQVLRRLQETSAAASGGRPSTVAETALERLYDLQRRARELDPAPVVCVDGLAFADVAHDVFGRMRDELWRLGFTWFVAVDSGMRSAFQEPPADAFFDVTVVLDELAADQAHELLAARDRDYELADDVREAIVTASRGSPRRLLALAREAIGGKPAETIVREAEIVDRVGDEIGEAAKRLLDELIVVGGASPSDEQLLRRLGWSRMRAQQVVSQLEDAGIVEVVGQRNAGRGRPRKIYAVKGLAQ